MEWKHHTHTHTHSSNNEYKVTKADLCLDARQHLAMRTHRGGMVPVPSYPNALTMVRFNLRARALCCLRHVVIFLSSYLSLHMNAVFNCWRSILPRGSSDRKLCEKQFHFAEIAMCCCVMVFCCCYACKYSFDRFVDARYEVITLLRNQCERSTITIVQ